MSLYLKEPSESSSVSPCLDLSSSRISSTSGPPEDMDRGLRSLHVPSSFFFCPPQLLSQVNETFGQCFEVTILKLSTNSLFVFYSLQIPLPMPTIPPISNPEAICESAATLVFLNIKLTRNMPTFIQLPPEDQVRITLQLIKYLIRNAKPSATSYSTCNTQCRNFGLLDEMGFSHKCEACSSEFHLVINFARKPCITSQS